MTSLIAGPAGREGRPFGTVLAAMVTPFTSAGELDLARDLLRQAVGGFQLHGLRLDAWHTALMLAGAEVRAGNLDGAREALLEILGGAEPAGGALVVRLARELGSEFGLELPTQTPPLVPRPDMTEAVEVAAPRLTGERLVSVLFADVRGYTASSASTPPVDLVDAIASLHRWASDEVRRHRGVIDKFAGDAVMATFNVSGNSVDHAHEAVTCGLALIEKAALAGLAVGAGVATGSAVVGRLTESGNLSVLGQATNLAARLQVHSEAGQLIVSDETRRRLGTAAGLGEGELVQVELKGFECLVTAYRYGAPGK